MPCDVDAVCVRSPWCRQKAQPSVLDMFAKLRRVIIATQFRRVDPEPPTPQDIGVIHLAWEDAAT